MFLDIFFIFIYIVAALCAWHICVADWRRRIIPDAYLWPLLICGVILAASHTWPIGPRMAAAGMATGYVLAAGIGFIFDWGLRRKNPTADAPIGMGDIKLIATGGVWLGPGGMAIALIAACITGAIWGMAHKQKYIPFAPFFVTGAILAFIIDRFLI